MRELKFDIISKQVGRDELHHDVMTLEEIEQASPDDFDYEVVARRLSTGIKDKADTEIYEGDIVKQDKRKADPFTDRTGDVRFDPKSRSYGIYQGDTFSSHLYAYEQIVTDCKVVGNIYDNPELLK